MTTLHRPGALRRLGVASIAAMLAVGATVRPHAALAAPADGPATQASCLVGSWAATDLDTYMQSALRVGPSSVTIEGVSGSMRMQFGADGSFAQQYDNTVVRSRMNGMAAVQTINGEAGGTYVEDGPNTIAVSGDRAAILMDMTLDGVPFLQGADMSALALASREYGPSRAATSCAGDRLEITPIFPDGRPASPMAFARVG
jgi:hypothetical protein